MANEIVIYQSDDGSIYEPSLPETTRFFRIIQNKLHFAATGHTAAELIAQRADHALPNMGLTSWARNEVSEPFAYMIST